MLFFRVVMIIRQAKLRYELLSTVLLHINEPYFIECLCLRIRQKLYHLLRFFSMAQVNVFAGVVFAIMLVTVLMASRVYCVPLSVIWKEGRDSKEEGCDICGPGWRRSK